MFLILLEGFAVILAIILVLSQILVPLFSGTPLFPWFRTSPEKAALEAEEDKLEEANELADIKNRVAALKDKVESKVNSMEK